MAKTILTCVGSNSISTTTTNYFRITNNNIYTTTEQETQILFRTAGTISDVQVRAITNGTTADSTVRLRKNGQNGNLSVTITAGQTGLFESGASTTDSISSGDLVNYSITLGSASASVFTAYQCSFAATTNTVTKLTTCYQSVGGANGNYHHSFGSYFYGAIAGTINTVQVNMRKTGTFKNLSIYFSPAYTSGTLSYCLNKNGSNTGIAASVPANQTGYFEDTTNTSSCSVDDDYCFAADGEYATGVSANAIKNASIEFETTDNSGLTVFGPLPGLTIFPKNTTNYTSVGGSGYFNSTITNVQAKAKEIFTFSDLQCYVTTNGSDQGGSVTLMNGSGATALTLSTGNQLTGLLQDTTHTVEVSAVTDLLSLRVINLDTSGGTHSISMAWISMFYTSAGAQGELKYGTISESPSVSVSESLARVQTINKAISDTPTVGVSETLGRIQTLIKPISDTPTISVSETLARRLVYPRPMSNEPEVSVSAGTLERIQYLIKLITNEPDVTVPAETLAKIAAYPRPISDTPSITVSETLEKILTDIRSITNEPIVSTDETLSKYAILPRPISDTPSITVSESLARIQYLIKLITNEPEVSISALATGNFLISKIINESPSVSVSETLERIQSIIKLISETPEVTISELLEGSLPIKIRSISEPSIDTTPTTIERTAAFARSITLTDEPLINVSETLASILLYLKNITNEPEITTSDVSSTLALMIRTLTDEPSTNISDELARIQSLIKLISETPVISTSDSVTAGMLLIATLLESRIKWYYSLLTRKIPEGET